jgi:hypothetical protein
LVGYLRDLRARNAEAPVVLDQDLAIEPKRI